MRLFLFPILLLSLALALVSCSPAVQEDHTGTAFILHGTIAGADSQQAYLLLYGDDQYTRRDSAIMHEGAFTFSGRINTPQRYYIEVEGGEGRAAFFMDGGEMQFEAHIDSLKVFSLQGSPLQSEFEAYEENRDKIGYAMLDMSRQMREAKAAGKADLASRLEARGDSLYDAMQTFSKSYVQEHGHSAVAAYILYRDLSFGSDYKGLDSLYQHLDSALSEIPYAKMVAERISLLREVAVGQPIKDFALPDSNTQPLGTENFRGKYLLIDFWASWCGPCRRENPNVVESYNMYRDKGFEILGVSFDTDRDKWLKAIRDDGLSWPQVSDLKGWSSAAGKLYGVRSIPHTVLVDPEGVIIARDLRGDALRKKLDALFGSS